LLSIITSAFQGSKYYSEYFRSLAGLRTTGLGFEIVFIHNSKTDEEHSAVVYFVDLYNLSSNFVWLDTARESLYASWNRGIKYSRGEWITFQNLDDERDWQNTFKALDILKQSDCLWGYGEFYVRSANLERREVRPAPFSPITFKSGYHAGPFLIFKRAVFQIYGYFDEQFKSAGDFEYIGRISNRCPGMLLNFNQGTFIIGDNNLSGRGITNELEKAVILLRHQSLRRVNIIYLLLALWRYDLNTLTCQNEKTQYYPTVSLALLLFSRDLLPSLFFTLINLPKASLKIAISVIFKRI
jgi:glycosyltransferase involved in cell wall biosynthesis